MNSAPVLPTADFTRIRHLNAPELAARLADFGRAFHA
jgi:hypothetical protein